MRYLPKSDSERQEMLAACGLRSAEELFSQIPAEARLNRPLDLAPGISEYEIVDYFKGAGGADRRRVTRRFWARAFITITGRWSWIRWFRAANF